MAKELRKICCGLARARDVTWFTELSDKGMLLWKLLLSMKQFAIQQEAPKCTCIGA